MLLGNFSTDNLSSLFPWGHTWLQCECRPSGVRTQCASLDVLAMCLTLSSHDMVCGYARDFAYYYLTMLVHL